MNKYINSLQSYILPSLTGLRATLLPLGGRRGWGRVCFFLLSLLLFAACSSDNDEQVQQPQPEKSYPLTIEVTENPMTGDGENSSNRAAITDNSSLASFKMDYTYGTTDSESSFTASKDTDGKWTSSGANWPGDAVDDPGISVNWHAYTGGTFNYNSGNPYINFTVDESAASQKDLLVAKTTDTWTNCSGHLSFTFDHVCSALRFFVKKSTNLNSYTVNITSVRLCNVIKRGKYYFGTPSWNTDDYIDTRSNYTLYTGTAITLGSGSSDWKPLNGGENDITGTNPYLFLIPQTLTAWDTSTPIASVTTQSYIEIECTISGTTNYSGTAYIPFGIVLAQGTVYNNLKINIGKNSLYKAPNTLIIPAS